MNLKIFALLNFIFFLSSFCLPQTKFGNSLDSLFTSYLDSGFSGSVLVAEKNKIVLEKCYSDEDIETKKT